MILYKNRVADLLEGLLYSHVIGALVSLVIHISSTRHAEQHTINVHTLLLTLFIKKWMYTLAKTNLSHRPN